MELIKGIDVSYAQGIDLPWKLIKESGIQFVIVRAGHGLKLDTTYENHLTGAKAEGLMVGSYWFFEADKEPITQARLYRTVLDKFHMVPFLDFETLNGVSPLDAMRRFEIFGRTLINDSPNEKEPIIYTCYDFWNNKLGNPESWVTELDLWIANYGVKKPLIPKPWVERGWRIWQYDGDGGERLPDNRDSDFCIAMGPLDSFKRVSNVDGETCCNTSLMTSRQLAATFLTQSMQTMVEGILEHDALERKERLKNADY